MSYTMQDKDWKEIVEICESEASPKDIEIDTLKTEIFKLKAQLLNIERYCRKQALADSDEVILWLECANKAKY